MKLSKEEILYMRAIASLAKVDAKACIAEGNTVSFLVPPGQMGAAIGKKGNTIKMFREKTGKKMEVYEYHKKAEDFVKKALKGVEMTNIEKKNVEGKNIISLALDPTNKRKLMQAPGSLARVRKVASTVYGIGEVRVG